VLVLAFLNRQLQPGLSTSLVAGINGLSELKIQHGPGSEVRLAVTACASICCVCRVNAETLTWTSESGWREEHPLRSRVVR
jgi:putative component of toxin-antitoxin plasmid stabilization module